MRQHHNIRHTVWIIGASSGIGQHIATQLLKNDANIIVTSRSAQSYAQYHNHPQVRIITLDVSQPFDEVQIFDTVLAQFGALNSVIYCAGVSQRSPDSALQHDVAQRLLTVNVMAFVQLCSAIVPYFINHQHGRIVGIGSLAGTVASPGRSIYSMAKSALRSYLETLHIELLPHHIAVQHFQIGFVKTAISQSALLGDGTPYNKMDTRQCNGMDAQKCAKKIIYFMRRHDNRFNHSIALQLRGRVALALRALCPKVLYKQLSNTIQ